MPNPFEHKATEALADEGFAAVGDGRFAAALWIARELKRRRFSAHFEIASRAFHAMGKLAKARRVLRRGVEVAPSVGVLWHWLATCQSDMGDFDAAAAAFHRSLELGQVHRGMELCNLALVELRRGRYDDGIRWLDQIAAEDDLEPSRAEQLLLRATLHFRAGRTAEAAKYAKRARRALTKHEQQVVPRICSLMSELALAGGKIRTARRLAKRTLRLDHRDRAALGVLRKSRAKRSERAKVWRVMLEGVAREDGETNGFFTHYDVIADDADEAFAYAREIERFAGHRKLRLEESRVLSDVADGPSGVIELYGGYVLFPDGPGACDTKV